MIQAIGHHRLVAWGRRGLLRRLLGRGALVAPGATCVSVAAAPVRGFLVQELRARVHVIGRAGALVGTASGKVVRVMVVVVVVMMVKVVVAGLCHAGPAQRGGSTTSRSHRHHLTLLLLQLLLLLDRLVGHHEVVRLLCDHARSQVQVFARELPRFHGAHEAGPGNDGGRVKRVSEFYNVLCAKECRRCLRWRGEVNFRRPFDYCVRGAQQEMRSGAQRE